MVVKTYIETEPFYSVICLNILQSVGRFSDQRLIPIIIRPGAVLQISRF